MHRFVESLIERTELQCMLVFTWFEDLLSVRLLIVDIIAIVVLIVLVIVLVGYCCFDRFRRIYFNEILT